MFYNNTASINYLEFDRLNPSSSTSTISAPITASFISASDYQGTIQFLDFTQYAGNTFNTSITAPINTSESVLRIVEVPNKLIPNIPGQIGQIFYSRLEQQTSNVNNKTWRLYVNSTGSLAGATLFNSVVRTANVASVFAAPTFYVSESALFYLDNTVAWDTSNKVAIPNYDVISSSLWIISTAQKAVASDAILELYAFTTMANFNTLVGEPTPL